MSAGTREVGSLSRNTNVTILLAARIIEVIEDSGAAQTEVLSALGVAHCLLPTLGISQVNEGDAVRPTSHPDS